MKVKIENAGPCRKMLKLEVPADQVAAEWDRILADYTKMARLDGFRKGKAPSDLVARHYGRDIAADAGDRLLNRAYREALAQEKLHPVAIIKVDHEELARDKPLAFTITLDMPPDFKLPKYKPLSLRGNKIEIAEEAVEARLKEILESMAEYTPADGRAAQSGDMVQLDFESFLDGRPLADAVPDARHLAAGKDMWWPIGTTNEIIPGLDQALVGVTAGQQKTVPVQFGAEPRVKSLANRSVEYRVTVKALRERKLPALDEALLKRLGMESEAALRTQVREGVTREAQAAERARLRDLAIKTLLGKTTIEVPESLVAEETRHMFYSLVRRRMLSGMTEAQLKDQRDTLLGEATQSATDMVKLGYILHRIADEEKVEVTDEEVSKRIEDLSRQSRQAPDEFRKQLEERHEVDSIRNEVRMDKTLDFILDHADIQTEGFLGRLISGVTGRKEAP